MTPALLFQVASTLVLPFWLLLIVAPRWRVTRLVVHGAIPGGLFGLLYLTALVLGHPGAEGGGFGSLEEVTILFTSPWTLTAGWIHYLVFDLFVGAWMARDAERRGIAHGFVVPCLGFTFMLGPIGLGLYLALRAALARRAEGANRFTLVETG